MGSRKECCALDMRTQKSPIDCCARYGDARLCLQRNFDNQLHLIHLVEHDFREENGEFILVDVVGVR
jgi:hypothetical protein